MVIYGNTSIPSDVIDVLSGGTVDVGAAFDASVAFIGGMDTANGSASTGQAYEVSSASNAADLFGDGSELHEATKRAFLNGAATVYALAVAETSTTESFSSTSSGTLSNAPIMDPNIHDEHSVSETNAGVDVTIVYDDPPQTPSSGINLNPRTGDWEAASSNTYDIDYTYGDYGTTAIDTLLAEEPRIACALTESVTVANDLATELNDDATSFQFAHGVAGAPPETDASAYTDGIDERRLSLVAPARGYIDDAETDEHRTLAGVAGYLASLTLGISSTNDSIGGYTGVRTEYTPSDAGQLIDEQVMPLIDYPPLTIVKDMTTSTDPKFERVYAMQVVDEITELTHQIAREFVGEQNTQANRTLLDRSLRNMLNGLESGVPPLLDDFSLSVTENNSDPNQVDVEIGANVVDTMDTIDVTLLVGDIVRFEGSS